MACQTLYWSSVLCTLIHVVGFTMCGMGELTATVAVCCLTSVLNHGYTHPVLRWADRCMMVIGAVWDVRGGGYVPVMVSVSLYGVSKVCGVVWPHVTAHCVLTVHHLTRGPCQRG